MLFNGFLILSSHVNQITKFLNKNTSSLKKKMCSLSPPGLEADTISLWEEIYEDKVKKYLWHNIPILIAVAFTHYSKSV